MIRLLHLIMCLPLLWLSACDVHEWPEMPENVTFHLRLNYETDLPIWEQEYDTRSESKGQTMLENGTIQYIIRAYPLERTTDEYTKEFIFTHELKNGYNRDFTLELPAGDYNLMVWSDFKENSLQTPFYNAIDFSEIKLQGLHRGNTDYRDAFRGMHTLSLHTSVEEYVPDTLDITMQRPLAKFEFISTDVTEFIEKEYYKAISRGEITESDDEDAASRLININDYSIVIYYSGFMPNTYSMFTDKPVDSTTGIMFESKISKINESEASLGFDYLFVNENQSTVSIQIGVYNSKGEQLSVTYPFEVPLLRSHHTILRGKYLMEEASEGVAINPEFEGEHNIII